MHNGGTRRQRTVDINRHLAVRCAEAVGTLSGVVRAKTGSAGDLVRERAEAAGNVVREQAEQAEKELARQGRQAEREQAKRELPKTGTVDELTERLVEADSK
jgi:hypothetical protein